MKLTFVLAGTLCTMPLAALAAPGVLRPLIVGLHAPAESMKALGKRLRATAKVPVQALGELSPTQISVTLVCKSKPQCDAAQARLEAASSWVKSVDVDGVRTRPTPAPAAAARSL